MVHVGLRERIPRPLQPDEKIQVFSPKGNELLPTCSPGEKILVAKWDSSQDNSTSWPVMNPIP